MRIAVALGLVVALLLAARGASADEPPWARGVSESQQAEALRLLAEGNRLFELAQRAQAVATYRRALAVWDHPAIRFNIAVALIDQDQPLEAYENLELALRYGSAALMEDQFTQGQTYRKLLLGQLARLEVSCAERGAKVLLDGRELLTAPGTIDKVLLPGEHQLVAIKAGYLTETRALTLVAGRSEVASLTLVPVPRVVRTERPWATWKPWALAGGGAAVALVGIPVWLKAAKDMDDYDRRVSLRCGDGCLEAELPEALRDRKRKAKLEGGVAAGLFAAGGAAIAGGLVWMAINQPRPVEEKQVVVVPAVTGEGVGLVVGGRF